jgi:hypothetical protein
MPYAVAFTKNIPAALTSVYFQPLYDEFCESCQIQQKLNECKSAPFVMI